MYPIGSPGRCQQSHRFPRIPGAVIQQTGSRLQRQPCGRIDRIKGERRFKHGFDRTGILQRLNLNMQCRLSKRSTTKR